ncbi:MAG TPA: hypothetical protein VF347_04120 [Candidatus Humimicrobiaceae bacterium]
MLQKKSSNVYLSNTIHFSPNQLYKWKNQKIPQKIKNQILGKIFKYLFQMMGHNNQTGRFQPLKEISPKALLAILPIVLQPALQMIPKATLPANLQVFQLAQLPI